MVDNADEFKCVNCGNKQGHAAWDRSCPAYQKALLKLRARRPESGFRLFPLADDPYSWESVDGGERLYRPDGGQQRWAPSAPRDSPQPPAASQREGSWFDDAQTETPDVAEDSSGTPSSQF